MAQSQTSSKSNPSNTSRRSTSNPTTSNTKSRSTNTNSKSIVRTYPNNAVGRAEMLVDEAEAAGISPRQLEVMLKLAKMVQGM